LVLRPNYCSCPFFNYNPNPPGRPLSGFVRDQLGEAGEGAVVGLFYLGGKDAGGQLVELEVVGDAIAALAFAGAGFISAGEPGFVGFNITFQLE